ncbi:MAG: hypothetical protein K2K55_10715, partial [Duncaniella sp.]|nr:hypothetical protein [Duncaniella sp.]
EKFDLKEKITEGLKKSYKDLLKRKAALGLEVVIADANGKPIIVPAKELLQRQGDNYGDKMPH